MSKITRILMMLTIAMIFAVNSVSATVDFSALTDLINATMTIFTTFNTNASTLISFMVLLGEISVVGAIIAFMVVLFAKIAKKLDSKMG